MNTTIYLIRHSVRFNDKNIEQYISSQNRLLRNEKIVLSVQGEKRAQILSDEEELQNLDAVYVSNCVRTLQTAKYILEKQKLKVTIDDRFDERRVGVPNDNVVKNWFVVQYLDENYKTIGGESQKEVRARFWEALSEALNEYKGKRIAVFSHGYAITFLIMKWCKFEYIESTDNLRFTFKGKEIYNQKMNSPEVFKLQFDNNNELANICVLKFDDLPFVEGIDAPII